MANAPQETPNQLPMRNKQWQEHHKKHQISYHNEE